MTQVTQPTEAQAKAAAAAAAPTASADTATTRLNKRLAELGLCSRREADEWIERGWVFVAGERISELGSRIDPDAEISISREAKQDQARLVTILLNKPVGYVSGQPEPGYAPAVGLIGPDNQADRDTAQRFHRGGGRQPRPGVARGPAACAVRAGSGAVRADPDEHGARDEPPPARGHGAARRGVRDDDDLTRPWPASIHPG